MLLRNVFDCAARAGREASDCRLIVYPRGQSQPPQHLSLFLEVTDPRNGDTDWSCFVSHRLSVVHQVRDRVCAIHLHMLALGCMPSAALLAPHGTPKAPKLYPAEGPAVTLHM